MKHYLRRVLPTTLVPIVVGLIATLATEPESAEGTFAGAQNGQIAFVSGRDRTGNGQIFVMGPNGENPTNISNTDDNDASPSFSADGQKIVFDGDPDIGNDELYVMSANGDGRQRLSQTEKDEQDPVFSPDGSTIAFTSFVNPGYDEVHLIGADGSNERPLVPPLPPAIDSSPAWSPDGSKIAFVRSQGSESQILVVNADGTNLTQLTPLDGRSDFDPDFSPDGSTIVFASDRDGPPQLYLMNADGTNQRRLTSTPLSDRDPAWSPDGSWIAFERFQDSSDSHTIDKGPGEIMVVDPSGQNLRNLTNDPEDDDEPSWQPLGAGADTTPPAFEGGPIAIAPVFAITGRSTPPRAVVARRATRGTTIRYRVSEDASVKLAVERVTRGIKRKRKGRTRCVRTSAPARVPKHRQCTLTKLAGWLVRSSRKGSRRIPFSGRIGRKALESGLYRIRAGAVDTTANPARHRSSRKFRVVRSRP